MRRTRLALAGTAVVLFLGCGEDVPAGPSNSDEDPLEYDPEWVAWIQNNAHAVTSLTSDDYADLQSIKPFLAGRRIVQLGESSHGVAEYNHAKVRLVKFLHEEMGFDVIAFESSLLNCFLANRDVQTLSPEALMTQSIYAVWHTEEVLPLFRYIKETHQTSRPLILAGFDLERINYYLYPPDQVFLGQVVAAIDSSYAHEVWELEARYARADADYESGSVTASHWANLQSEYQELVGFIDDNWDELNAVYSNDRMVPLMARQAAWATAKMIALYRASDRGIRFAIRDSTMADNIGFLLDTAYPDERVIAWAHNAHIRHNGEDVSGNVLGVGYPSMGQHMARRHRPELYTVALLAYSGTGSDLARSPYGFCAGPNTVEALLRKSAPTPMFLDMLGAERNDSTEWMFETRESLSWQIPIRLVPRDQYDAILLIDDVNRPEYAN